MKTDLQKLLNEFNDQLKNRHCGVTEIKVIPRDYDLSYRFYQDRFSKLGLKFPFVENINLRDYISLNGAIGGCAHLFTLNGIICYINTDNAMNPDQSKRGWKLYSVEKLELKANQFQLDWSQMKFDKPL